MEETYSKLNSTHKIVVTMLQQLVTECAGWYWLHSLVHLLQQLVTECTDWYWLHSLVHLLQQLVTECTGWYWLHSLVHLLQQLVTECTDWFDRNDYQMSQMWHTTACRVQTKPVWELRKPWGLDPR